MISLILSAALDGRAMLDCTEAFMADTLTIRRKKEVLPTMLSRLAIPEGRVRTVPDLERYIHASTTLGADHKSLSFKRGEYTIRIFQSAGGGWRISCESSSGAVFSRPCPIAGDFFAAYIVPRLRSARRAEAARVKRERELELSRAQNARAAAAEPQAAA